MWQRREGKDEKNEWTSVGEREKEKGSGLEVSLLSNKRWILTELFSYITSVAFAKVSKERVNDNDAQLVQVTLLGALWNNY